MTQALAQARKALEAATVAMKIASALPNVSDEYDFDPAIAECSAALAAIDAALEGGAVPKVIDCATEGCWNPATVHFERGGVGSDHCHACYLKIQSLSGA